jgi:hypothetical protein
MNDLQLAPLGTLTLTMGESTRLDATPSGTRVIVDFDAVRWSGDRLDAKARGRAAADWLVVGADGTAMLDIRFTLETANGALIYVQTHGRADAATFPKGGALYLAPLFETGDARYAWLNRVQAVAKGHLDGRDVIFSVFEVR